MLPQVDATQAFTTLGRALAEDDGKLVQNTHAVLTRAVTALCGNTAGVDSVLVRRALCLPASGGIRLFPGAVELLARVRRRGLRCVIVSNVQVRGADEYWRDFADLGIAEFIDRVVTSLDVGFRKPHPAIFEAALRAAGCEAGRCVMIGNSETKDIQPAVAMGMRTIRATIEEPLPHATAAEAVADTLTTVTDVLERWSAV